MNLSEKNIDWLYSNYIGIYYIHSKWKENMYNNLLNHIPSKNIINTYINKDEACIDLNNGTKIKICPETSFLGSRFHKTYYEPGTPQEIIDTLIRPCMVYNYPQEITIVKEENE